MGHRSHSGFTLVETVLVMAIIAILATLGVAAFPPILESMHLQSASTALVDTMREAQQHAVADGRLWRVVFAADLRSYRLQYAVSPSASSYCDSTGWADFGSPKSLPSSISITDASRPCVTFSSAGRSEWPYASVINYNGFFITPPVADGEEITQQIRQTWLAPGHAVADPRVASWKKGPTPAPTFTVDVGEIRPYTTACLGMLSWPPGFRFPATVTVEAARADTGPWTLLRSGPTGLTNPGNNVYDRQCLTIPVNGSYQFFRFNFTYNGNYIVLDEFDVANLHYKLSGAKKARLLVVKPVTGRIVVQAANP